jgi:hypothetical protein
MPDAVLAHIAGLCDWLVSGGPGLDTEFLGDLYQAHCEEARKGRALVQTPGFVRELILDRTLGEVLRQHGPMAAKTIDPTCGCGHFLVDAFRRTFAAWMEMPRETLVAILNRTGGFDPSDPMEAIVAQIALDQVVGVDLDPVCVAISRARLIFEAWAACDVRMPFRVHVHEGDALLHHRPMPGDDTRFGPWTYDVEAIRRALCPGQYTAVVGNPPYITGKDAKLREAYRQRYPTCHGQFSLAVPFTEVFFGLARGEGQARPVVKEEQGTLFASMETAS